MRRLLLVLALPLGCGARTSAPREPDAAPHAAVRHHEHACSLDVGQKIAPVTGTSLFDRRPITFPSGKVTLVAFLESGNRYLERTVPHLKDLRARYQSRGLDVIVVDEEPDGQAELPAFWRRHGPLFPIVWGASRSIAQKLRSSPVTVALFDESGVVRYVGDGDPATEDIDGARLARETLALLDDPRSTIPSYSPPPCETELGQRFQRTSFRRLDVPAPIAIPTGKWTLVAFIATYSEPSKRAIAALAKLADTHRARGLTVVAVAILDSDRDGAVPFVHANGGAALPIIFDEGNRLLEELQPTTEPAFILLDADGVVRHIVRGYREAAWDAEVRALDEKLL